MKKLHLATTIIFLIVTFFVASIPAGAEEKLIYTATAPGWSNYIPIDGEWTGLQLKLENGAGGTCKFELYNDYKSFLFRGPTYPTSFNDDKFMTWKNYFTYKNDTLYYKNTTKQVKGLYIKSYVMDGSVTMNYYLTK